MYTTGLFYASLGTLLLALTAKACGVQSRPLAISTVLWVIVILVLTPPVFAFVLAFLRASGVI